MAEKQWKMFLFMLRSEHLASLRRIIDDPEATDNDRFVAYNLLQNAAVARGRSIAFLSRYRNRNCGSKQGENVYTGVDDGEFLSRGIFNTYKNRNLRYSQIVPLSMFEEKNSGSTFLHKLIFMRKKEIITNFYS